MYCTPKTTDFNDIICWTSAGISNDKKVHVGLEYADKKFKILQTKVIPSSLLPLIFYARMQ